MVALKSHRTSEVKVSVTTRDAGSAGTGINTQDIDPMLMKCWVDILNDEPTMNQFSGKASWFLMLVSGLRHCPYLK